MITYIIAAVWIVNGLFCKVLDLVPRHAEIVGRILGEEHRSLTILIGIMEVAMAIWILSGYKPKLNAGIQIGVVAAMNLIEFVLAPDLLLWGKLNSLFAFLFIILIYVNAFHLGKTGKSG